MFQLTPIEILVEPISKTKYNLRVYIDGIPETALVNNVLVPGENPVIRLELVTGIKGSRGFKFVNAKEGGQENE